ncbi:MAG: hypothetical protein U5L74_13495 [Ideonella sp.]|nr:hypothetical protein [Ideonella sp.]
MVRQRFAPAWMWAARTLEMQLSWLLVAGLMALCAGAVTALVHQVQGVAVLTLSTEVHSQQIEQLAMTGEASSPVVARLSTPGTSPTQTWTAQWDGRRVWAQVPGPTGTLQPAFSIALAAPAASAPQWAAGWRCQASPSSALRASDLPSVCR